MALRSRGRCCGGRQGDLGPDTDPRFLAAFVLIGNPTELPNCRASRTPRHSDDVDGFIHQSLRPSPRPPAPTGRAISHSEPRRRTSHLPTRRPRSHCPGERARTCAPRPPNRLGRCPTPTTPAPATGGGRRAARGSHRGWPAGRACGSRWRPWRPARTPGLARRGGGSSSGRCRRRTTEVHRTRTPEAVRMGIGHTGARAGDQDVRRCGGVVAADAREMHALATRPFLFSTGGCFHGPHG